MSLPGTELHHYRIIHVEPDWKVWRLTVEGCTLMVRIPREMHPEQPRVGDVVSVYPPPTQEGSIQFLAIGERRIV